MSKRVVHSFEELGRAQANKRVAKSIDSSKVITDFQSPDEPESEREPAAWVKRRRMQRELIGQAIQEAFPTPHVPTFAEQFMKKDDES